MAKSDPMERIIEQALNEAGIPYFEDVPVGARALDFYLPDYAVYIEVKQFHSDRIASQMGQCNNIIAVQGRVAVELFAQLLRKV